MCVNWLSDEKWLSIQESLNRSSVRQVRAASREHSDSHVTDEQVNQPLIFIYFYIMPLKM